jgi:flagellar biosynthesis chaperone FliJ
MKSKAQKREEAIERNSQYRDKYLKEAEEKGYVGLDAKEYADRKQGISAKKVVPTYTY